LTGLPPYVAVLGKVPGTEGDYSDRERHPQNEVVSGVPVLRVEGDIFFANAETVRNAIRTHAAAEGTRAVVLDTETVLFLDVTAARMLAELARELRQDSAPLLMARATGQVRDVLRTAGGTDVQMFPTIQAAVEYALTLPPPGPPAGVATHS